MVVAACFWVAGCGGGGGGGTSSLYPQSVNRLHSLNLSLLMYASDYDNVLPPPSKWMDSLVPYAKDQTLYRSPAVAAKGYGYALNAQIAGTPASEFASPAEEITLFDSVDLSRNATDPISSQPSPPRYGINNTIAYLDGHVKDYNTVNSVPIYSQSRQNMSKIALATLMYSNDYDDVLPLTGQWMDKLLPYAKNDDLFHSPAIFMKNSAEYGYAFNSTLAGGLATNIVSPSTTPMIFDSTVLSRNATASISTLPTPPRYGKQNTISYVDGHVHP